MLSVPACVIIVSQNSIQFLPLVCKLEAKPWSIRLELATGLPTPTNAWTYTARHGYFLLVLYFLFNVYVVLDAIPATNVPGPSGI